MVRLISAEGFDFYVDREAACVSNTIKSMLNSEGEAWLPGGCARLARRETDPG